MKLLQYSLAVLTLVITLTLVQPKKTLIEDLSITQIPSTIKSRYRKVYGTHNSPRMLKNFAKLITTVKYLSGSGEKQLVGYRQLETEMNNRGLQNSIQVIQLHAALQSTNDIRNQQAKRGIEAIRNRIGSKVRCQINKFVSAIVSKKHISYMDAVRLSKSDPDAMETITFDLISKAYASKLERFEACFTFLKNAAHPKVQMAGYYALATAMFNNGQLDSPEVFQLAVGVKKIGSSKFRSKKLSRQGMGYMQWIIGKLPKNVIAIAFNGKKCKIKNDHFGTYLYADTDWLDARHRFDFLWARPSENKPGDLWNFEPIGSGKTWYIKNLSYNKYLIAEASSMNQHKSRRRTFLWRVEMKRSKPETGKWSLSPLKGGTISIRNAYWNNEYLYADGKYCRDSNRRNLFTWEDGKPQGKMWLESKWDVTCTGNPNS